MFTLTRNERIALIALVGLLILGGVVSWLEHLRPERIEDFRVVPGPLPPEASPGAPDSEQGPSGPARVNVNLASAQQLEQLPRIGPTIAERIISHRVRHGPFESLQGLGDVEGIGPGTLAVLDSLVTFVPDSAAAH